MNWSWKLEFNCIELISEHCHNRSVHTKSINTDTRACWCGATLNFRHGSQVPRCVKTWNLLVIYTFAVIAPDCWDTWLGATANWGKQETELVPDWNLNGKDIHFIESGFDPKASSNNKENLPWREKNWASLEVKLCETHWESWSNQNKLNPFIYCSSGLPRGFINSPSPHKKVYIYLLTSCKLIHYSFVGKKMRMH